MTGRGFGDGFWFGCSLGRRVVRRLAPEGWGGEDDPAVMPLLANFERYSQRMTAILRLLIGPVFFGIAFSVVAVQLRESNMVLYATAAYMTMAVLSLIASTRRFFRPLWAPLFIVLDVAWYEFVICAGLFVFDLPMTAYASLPTAALIYFFLALAGMRFTPSALLAGLATFVVIDGAILVLVALGLWPVPLVDSRIYFGPLATAFRFAVVIAVGLVTAITAWRSRRLLSRALSEMRQRERARRLVGHFVPDALTERLMETDGVLPPAHRTATIVYTDIAGFTSIVEQLPPETVIEMLDAYFAAVEGAILEAGGTVTQFQGDAVLAVFNVPVERADHAARGLAAGRRVAEIATHETFAGQRLPTRVGVNTGEVVAGTVSGVERVGYTVHGDAVNLAARLEAMNKEFGTRLLVSASTVAALDPDMAATLKPVGKVQVRGRAEPVEVFTLAGGAGDGAVRPPA